MNGNRWAVIVLSSFAPLGAGGLVLREDDVDWAGAWERFTSSMNAKARLGARIAVLIAMSAPLWTMGRVASLAKLSAEKRTRVLEALLSHRIFVVRELALLLKVCACLAMLRSDEVRARTSYDGPAPIARRSLPVLAVAS